MHPNIKVLILNTLTLDIQSKLSGNKEAGKDFIEVLL